MTLISIGALLFLAAIAAVLYSKRRPHTVECLVQVGIDGHFVPTFLRKTVMTSIVVGKTAVATATAAPVDPSVTLPHLDYIWTSSDPAVAAVGSDGNITALATGSATITAAISTTGFTGSGSADISVAGDTAVTVTVNIVPNP